MSNLPPGTTEAHIANGWAVYVPSARCACGCGAAAVDDAIVFRGQPWLRDCLIRHAEALSGEAKEYAAEADMVRGLVGVTPRSFSPTRIDFKRLIFVAAAGWITATLLSILLLSGCMGGRPDGQRPPSFFSGVRK